MEDNTAAIIALAWGRQLGLADDVLTPGDRTVVRAGSDTRAMVLRLWHQHVLVGPDWLQQATPDDAVPELTDLSALLRHCAGLGTPGRAIGQASLAYADDLVRREGLDTVPVAAEPESVAELERACPPDDVAEAGLGHCPYTFVTLDDRGQPTAGSGYTVWEGLLGHVGVLTPPELRRFGYGTTAAGVAVNDALDAGLVPQWRARVDNLGSQRMAARLGFSAAGTQTTLALR